MKVMLHVENVNLANKYIRFVFWCRLDIVRSNLILMAWVKETIVLLIVAKFIGIGVVSFLVVFAKVLVVLGFS